MWLAHSDFSLKEVQSIPTTVLGILMPDKDKFATLKNECELWTLIAGNK